MSADQDNPNQPPSPPPVPPPSSPADPLADAARRQELQARLVGLGMTAEEIARLLAPGPAVPAAGQPPAPGADASGMRGLADRLLQDRASEIAHAAEHVDLGLPPLRESSLQEQHEADQLLREAHMLRRREKFVESEAKCRQALSAAPKDAAALEFLGDLAQGTGRIEQALAAYKRAGEADPRRASAQRKYADLLMLQQNWAVKDPEAVPRNPYVAVLLSLILPGAGQVYNLEAGKGVFFLVCSAVFAYLIFWSRWGLPGGHRGGGLSISVLVFFVLGAALYIAALIDANVVARVGGGRAAGKGWNV